MVLAFFLSVLKYFHLNADFHFPSGTGQKPFYYTTKRIIHFTQHFSLKGWSFLVIRYYFSQNDINIHDVTILS